MQLTLQDLLDNQAFQAQRAKMEQVVLQDKALRRIRVAQHAMFLFENRTTIQWQIQEMCRVEHIENPEARQHELDTYNALLPTTESLSATLLLEYVDPDERDKMLARLLGLHQHIFMVIGSHRSAAVFDDQQYNETRVSSVQFIRFPLTDEQRRAFLDFQIPAKIVVDHPALEGETALAGPVRGALAQDLLAAQ